MPTIRKRPPYPKIVPITVTECVANLLEIKDKIEVCQDEEGYWVPVPSGPKGYDIKQKINHRYSNVRNARMRLKAQERF